MRFLLILLAATFFSCASFAQIDQASLDSIDARAKRLNTISVDLQTENPDLLSLRDLIRDLKREAENQTAPFRTKLAEVTSDLERLGPAPADDMPTEASAISEERIRLNTELSQLNGILRKSDLNMAEADRLLQEISKTRRDQFSSNIFEQDETILNPTLWKETFGAVQEDAAALNNGLRSWSTAQLEKGQGLTTLLVLGFSVLVMLVCFLPLRKQLRNFISKRLEGVEPHGSRKVLVLAAYTLARMLPALIGGWIFYQTLHSLNAIPSAANTLSQTIWLGFVGLVMVDGAATGIIAPYAPNWRISSLKDVSAFKLRALVFIAAFTIIFERILIEGMHLSGGLGSVHTLLTSITTIILAVILYLLCQSSLWTNKARALEEPIEKPWPRTRFVGKMLAIASVLMVLSGYVNFGHYLTTSTFYLAALAAVTWVVRSLFREIVRLFDVRFTNPDNAESEHDSVLFYWIGFGIDAVSVLLFIPPALLLLGAEWADVRDGISDAFVGIQVGSFNFSILKILTAIALFLVVLSLTRMLQRTAETRVFPQSRIDSGVQNSLKTLIGYVGLTIALLLAISAVGFNLANLAIIAGALSIGIGFGLQSIVSNFVSGLILLFERPIKVGDWIVTTSGEGFVQKISVRSTEIETFDKATVIIPNSELISGAVTNWTHKDKIGRVIINVGVSYDADPEEVIALLGTIADEHPQILSYPVPMIYFADFADSSLNFEFRGFISDIKTGLKIRSELRVAIFKKLKEAGIEIPFPQRDLHIKTDKGA